MRRDIIARVSQHSIERYLRRPTFNRMLVSEEAVLIELIALAHAPALAPIIAAKARR
jgi:hypothetical protein